MAAEEAGENSINDTERMEEAEFEDTDNVEGQDNGEEKA